MPLFEPVVLHFHHTYVTKPKGVNLKSQTKGYGEFKMKTLHKVYFTHVYIKHAMVIENIKPQKIDACNF